MAITGRGRCALHFNLFDLYTEYYEIDNGTLDYTIILNSLKALYQNVGMLDDTYSLPLWLIDKHYNYYNEGNTNILLNNDDSNVDYEYGYWVAQDFEYNSGSVSPLLSFNRYNKLTGTYDGRNSAWYGSNSYLYIVLIIAPYATTKYSILTFGVDSIGYLVQNTPFTIGNNHGFYNIYDWGITDNSNTFSLGEAEELGAITEVNVSFMRFPSEGLPLTTTITPFVTGETLTLQSQTWNPADATADITKTYTCAMMISKQPSANMFANAGKVNVYTPIYSTTVKSATWIKLNNNTIVAQVTFNPINSQGQNPYENNGYSDTSNPPIIGDTDNGESDNITFPEPIPLSQIGGSIFNGIATVYLPTISQFQNFIDYLWGQNIWDDVNTLMNGYPSDIVSEALISHHLIPLNPISLSAQPIKIGWLYPTPSINMSVAPSEFQDLNCGSVNLIEHWNGYMDYHPFTTVKLYLPYIGYVPLNSDEAMQSTITIKYRVCIATGDFSCMVQLSNTKSTLNNATFLNMVFTGNCAMKLPLTGKRDITEQTLGKGLIAAMTGTAIGAVTGGITGAAIGAMSGFASFANNMIGQKQFTDIIGQLGSNGGLLSPQKPHLIISYPKQLVPKNQHKYTGYPSFVTMILSSCKGFTQIADINMENVPCMDEEFTEIINYLKEGVIIG